MGFLDRLLGRTPASEQGGGYAPISRTSPPARATGQRAPERSADEQAIERYRYMLRTAPPETVEAAHAEAFAALTPEQRRKVLGELSSQLPEAERTTTADDPQSLARAATRAEVRQPGTLERAFGGRGGGGVGLGGIVAGSLLASVAGAFIGTAIADSLFDGDGAFGDDGGGDGGGGDDVAQDDQIAADDAGDWGGGDAGGGDFGGDFGGGDFGGDF